MNLRAHTRKKHIMTNNMRIMAARTKRDVADLLEKLAPLETAAHYAANDQADFCAFEISLKRDSEEGERAEEVKHYLSAAAKNVSEAIVCLRAAKEKTKL